MPCGSCGKRSAMTARFGAGTPVSMGRTRGPLPNGSEEWPLVSYQGASVNHYIVSPTRKVKHYGYGAKGAQIRVHPDDIKAKPNLFLPVSIEEAMKVWPGYPMDAAQVVVAVLGLPQDPALSADSQSAQVTVDEETLPQDLPDVNQMTVNQIRALDGFAQSQWQLLLDAEIAGQNRKTAVDFLTEKVGA